MSLHVDRHARAVSRSVLKAVLAVLCVLALSLAAGYAARADEGTGVSVELNKLENREGACRLYFVVTNRSPRGFDALPLDLVMFGTDGVIARRVALDLAPVRPGKTSVKLFDMKGLACSGIGRVLLNDVTACGEATGAPGKDCLGHVTVTSRAGVPFVK